MPELLASAAEEARGGVFLQLPEKHDRHDMLIHKYRKVTSTGGGRAWTEEEESYLLRTRQRKMPYKHIAAHLHKTELACRLHYHQMSYGSSRRKRTGSISSNSSCISQTPIPAVYDSSPEHTPSTRLSPVASPPSSPEFVFNKLSPGYTSSPAPQRSPLASIHPNSVLSEKRDFLPTPVTPTPVDSLRLDTSVARPNDRRVYHSKQIDDSRLKSLYVAYRHSFWTLIANQYSPESPFSPSQLEEAFFAANLTESAVPSSSLPTPRPSPGTFSEQSLSAAALTKTEPRSFSAVNEPPTVSTAFTAPSPGGRCAVSALLNGPRDFSN